MDLVRGLSIFKKIVSNNLKLLFAFCNNLYCVLFPVISSLYLIPSVVWEISMIKSLGGPLP